MSARDEVLAAAAAIVDDFGHHRTAEYFAGFAPDATFLFYTHTARLDSRADYEALWASWETNDGFRVHGCRSSAQHVQVIGDSEAGWSWRVAGKLRRLAKDDGTGGLERV